MRRSSVYVVKKGCYATWNTRRTWKNLKIWCLTEKSRKSQGISAFHPKFRENQGIWENLKLEAVIMPTLKPIYPAIYIGHIKWFIFFLFVTKSQTLIDVIYNWNILIFSSNTIFTLPPVCRITVCCWTNFFLKMIREKSGNFIFPFE